MPAIIHNLHNINALYEIIVHRLGVGPLAKTNINMFMQAKENLLFQTTKVIFFYMFIYISIFLNFPEFNGIF